MEYEKKYGGERVSEVGTSDTKYAKKYGGKRVVGLGNSTGDLSEYRTAADQDIIDNEQNNRLDALETNNYFNVVNETPVNILETPVTVITIPAESIVAGYNYRIFANVLATRTGGGANVRTELLFEIKQGATIVTSGNVIMWQDEEVFLPIPQLAKRFIFNDTEPITIECTNANAIGAVVFNNSSITIE